MGKELSPDGQQKIFGARNIARHCQQAKIPDVDRPSNSIADKPHKNSREVERRLRQEAKRRST